MRAEDVLSFWYEETDHALWFRKDEAFDARIRERFGPLHAEAVAGELWKWRKTPRGRLAEILVLDQFSRNLYRDDSRAFAADGMALVLAQEAVALKDDHELTQEERWFLYLPMMHSESRCIHEWAEALFVDLGLEEVLRFERAHRAIIERFGRYPHRNAVLGRKSTLEEQEFLKQEGSSF